MSRVLLQHRSISLVVQSLSWVLSLLTLVSVAGCGTSGTSGIPAEKNGKIGKTAGMSQSR